MAGRGTDIKLGEGVQSLGGLFILGTGRHESRRIDLQLRGRAGRQGDKGGSVFYLSLEDNLMRLFGSDKISKVMDTMGIKEGEVITHSMVTRSIERAQKKIEAMNFGSRKNLIEYDDVMNYQREIVYNRRNYSLHVEIVTNAINEILNEYIEDILDEFCSSSSNLTWDLDNLNQDLLNTFGLDMKIESDISSKKQLKQIILDGASAILKFKEENFDYDMFNDFKKYVILRTIDQKWQDHLHMMDQLREGINLRAYGQKNPLIEYKQEGFLMFEIMMQETNRETLKRIFRTDLSKVGVQSMQSKSKTQNIQMKKNQDILSGLTPRDQDHKKSNVSSFPGAPQQHARPNQKVQPIKVEKKIGRNDLCPCGSGKKYKKCCA